MVTMAIVGQQIVCNIYDRMEKNHVPSVVSLTLVRLLDETKQVRSMHACYTRANSFSLPPPPTPPTDLPLISLCRFGILRVNGSCLSMYIPLTYRPLLTMWRDNSVTCSRYSSSDAPKMSWTRP